MTRNGFGVKKQKCGSRLYVHIVKSSLIEVTGVVGEGSPIVKTLLYNRNFEGFEGKVLT